MGTSGLDEAIDLVFFKEKKALVKKNKQEAHEASQ